MTGAVALHIVALAAGMIFGAVYLAILWGAVHLLAHRKLLPVFLLAGLLRAGLLIAALTGGLALGATPSHIAAALLGFVIVRIVATRSAKSPVTGPTRWK